MYVYSFKVNLIMVYWRALLPTICWQWHFIILYENILYQSPGLTKDNDIYTDLTRTMNHYMKINSHYHIASPPLAPLNEKPCNTRSLILMLFYKAHISL